MMLSHPLRGPNPKMKLQRGTKSKNEIAKRDQIKKMKLQRGTKSNKMKY
jgi:hypothetical protein